MTEIKNVQNKIYLSTDGNSVEMNWRFKSFVSIWQYYDKNADGIMSQDELVQIKKDLMDAAGADKKLDKAELKKLASKFGMSEKEVLQFFYNIDGDLIGQDLNKKLNPGLFGKKNFSEISNLINKINPSNITKVSYTYKSKNKEGFFKFGTPKTIADDIMSSFELKDAIPLMQKLFNTASQACKDNNVNVDNIIQNFNKAVQQQDKNGITKYTNDLLQILDSIEVNKGSIDECRKTQGAPGTDATGDIESRAKSLGVDTNSDDFLGDGILGNTFSRPNTPEGNLVLQAVKSVLSEDPVMKEKIQAAVRKENDMLSVHIPRGNNVYTYDEEGLTRTYKDGSNVILDSTLGDGDMSLLVFAIIREANDAGINIKNTDELRNFITGLFE